MNGFRPTGLRLLVCSSVVLIALSLSTLPAGAAPGSRAVPWSPNPGSFNSLIAVSADSASDAWAVGYYETGGGVDKTLIVHWNGSSWSKLPSPNPNPNYNVLGGVTAVSPTDAWAVGQTKTGTIPETLIMHWNGTKWTRVPSPSPGIDGILLGVAASPASGKNAWAVGSYLSSTGAESLHTLILHWNGTAWSRVKSPNPTTQGNALSGVSMTSAKSAWAVGSISSGDQTLILHWNGTKWSQVKSFSVSGDLTSVSSASPSTGWAVGSDDDSPTHTIIAARSGSTWSTEASPNPSAAGNYLYGVSADSATSAWAVGYETQSSDQYILIARWSGTIWQQVPGVNPSSTSNKLYGISAVSTTSAWAVGSYVDDNTSDTDTLILHWNGTSWTQQ